MWRLPEAHCDWRWKLVYCYQPEKKRASKGRHSSISKPQTFLTQASAAKEMLMLMRADRYPLIEHYIPKGTTVTNVSYCNLLRKHIRPAMRSEPHGLLSIGVLLLSDKAWPRTVRVTVETIREIYLKCLPHLRTIKGGSGRKDFPIRWRIARGGAWVATHADKGFLFPRGIQSLVKRWRTCIECKGDYAEK
jgi:hypothetical protein